MSNKISSKAKQVILPKIRFPEFQNTSKWEIKTLGSIAENLDFKRIPVTEQYRVKGHIPYYGASGVIDYINDYIFDDDLLCISEDGANLIARNYPIAFSIIGKTWVNNHAHVLKFKSPFLQFIVKEYLNTISLENYLTGMAQPKLNRAKLDVIPIPLPNSKEQKLIAECLISISNLISEQNKKLDVLKAYKKGLMQQLFPAEGETIPKLRFPEFQNTLGWKSCLFGDICDVRDGTHDSPSFHNTGKPLITSKNLLSNGLLDLENVSYISNDDYEKINKRSRVEIGDILFGMIGTIGNPVMVRSDGFAIKNVALIKQKTDLMNSYLVHFLSSQYIVARFNALNTGNTQKFIALGQIRNLTFPIPAKAEQYRIAETLSSIDDIIIAKSLKLDVLKNHKKGLMQQLFPLLSEF